MTKFLSFLVLLLLVSTGELTAQGPCLRFDGSNDKIMTNSQVLNGIGTGNFTFEVWVNGEVGGGPTNQTIFSNRSSASQGIRFLIQDYSAGSLYKAVSVQLSATNYFVPDNGTFNAEILDGTCHHVAVTRESSVLRFYIDGILIGTDTINGTPSATSSQKIWVGQDPIQNHAFNGSITMLKIWNLPLDEPEINASMNCDSTDYSGLVAHWRLDEGSGQFIQEELSGALSNLGTGSLGDNQDPSWNFNCCATGTDCFNSALPGDTTTTPPNPQPELPKVEVDLAFPNIVTPDEDGKNDLFTPIKLIGVSELHCTIVNRWGNVMYETNDILINWDASEATEGVYYYVVEYLDDNGDHGRVNGFFHVVK